MRVHLDTDFGGDPDDACALAMLLGWRGAELLGVTTALEHQGRRAGCVRHVLGLAGRLDVPVAAGAEQTLTGGRYESTWGDERHWPVPVEQAHGPVEKALDLLARNIAAGATVIAIGGFTNLAMLERTRPGSLHDVPVVAMAGWFAPPADGLPPWGADADFNTQVDTEAAAIVAAVACVTFVPLPVALSVTLRGRDLPRLRSFGPLGRLLAAQSERHASDSALGELVRAHTALPADLVNVHWDPLTVAVALGWVGAVVGPRRLATRLDDGVLRFVDDPRGREHRVVVSVDAPSFAERWLDCVGRAALGHAG